MKHKKIISIALALVMHAVMLPMFSVVVSAETEKSYENTGLYYQKYDYHCEITDCDTNVSWVIIPNEIENLPVTSIGSYAFSGCSNLNDITIGNSVTSIGIDAFFNTGYYNEEYNWTKNNGVLYIGNYLIKADEEKISGDIEIENGTKLIADGAFSCCKSLTSIKIPDTVTNIGSRAFYSCSKLTSLYIPSAVTSIGSEAFYGCSGLNCINYDGTKKEWKAITIDSTNELTNVEINYLREPPTTTVNGKSLPLRERILTDILLFWHCIKRIATATVSWLSVKQPNTAAVKKHSRQPQPTTHRQRLWFGKTLKH